MALSKHTAPTNAPPTNTNGARPVQMPANGVRLSTNHTVTKREGQMIPGKVGRLDTLNAVSRAFTRDLTDASPAEAVNECFLGGLCSVLPLSGDVFEAMQCALCCGQLRELYSTRLAAAPPPDEAQSMAIDVYAMDGSKIHLAAVSRDAHILNVKTEIMAVTAIPDPSRIQLHVTGVEEQLPDDQCIASIPFSETPALFMFVKEPSLTQLRADFEALESDHKQRKHTLDCAHLVQRKLAGDRIDVLTKEMQVDSNQTCCQICNWQTTDPPDCTCNDPGCIKCARTLAKCTGRCELMACSLCRSSGATQRHEIDSMPCGVSRGGFRYNVRWIDSWEAVALCTSERECYEPFPAEGGGCCAACWPNRFRRQLHDDCLCSGCMRGPHRECCATFCESCTTQSNQDYYHD